MQKLKEELYKIVYDYSIDERLADKAFVEKILDLCIEAFDINDYVVNREIKDYATNDNINAGYWIDKKKIVFSLEPIKNDGISRIIRDKEYGIQTNSFLDYFKMNSNFMYGVIHELTHVCQYKKCLEEVNDLETEILKINLDRNLVLLKNKKLSPQEIWYYQQLDRHFLGGPYYEACPSERMADIRGLEYERDIAKLLDENKKLNIETYTELRLLNGKINGYHECSPTTFVTSVNETLKNNVGLPHKHTDIKSIEYMYRVMAKKHNLSYDERIWLGLPITEEEKQKVYQKRIELQNILLKKD